MKTQLFFALVLFATLSQAVPSGSKTIPSLAKQLRFRRNLAKVMKEMLEKSKDFSPSVSNRDAVLKVDQSKIRNQADMKIALGKKVREVMERGDKLAKTSRQDCPPGQTCIDLFGNGECKFGFNFLYPRMTYGFP